MSANKINLQNVFIIYLIPPPDDYSACEKWLDGQGALRLAKNVWFVRWTGSDEILLDCLDDCLDKELTPQGACFVSRLLGSNVMLGHFGGRGIFRTWASRIKGAK